jgi:AcrR family transcriptional regulator
VIILNKKFFELPLNKQNKIINAGYKTFSENIYKKASMAFIAGEANISKSLLFHYFRNKKALYIFLFESALKLVKNNKKLYIHTNIDFFDAIEHEIIERGKLVRKYPYIYQFIANVYYETDEEVRRDIIEFNVSEISKQKDIFFKYISKNGFKNPNDVEGLYEIVMLMAEGIMKKYKSSINKNIEIIELEFLNLLENLKRNYYK